MIQYDRQAALERIVAAVAAEYRRIDDPGASDLTDECPMSIHLPLSVLRAARTAIVNGKPEEKKEAK